MTLEEKYGVLTEYADKLFEYCRWHWGKNCGGETDGKAKCKLEYCWQDSYIPDDIFDYEAIVEYESPVENLPVDTKIYVRDGRNDPWEIRHFSHYSKITGRIYTFWENETSDSCQHDRPDSWTYAKLIEKGDDK